MVGILDGKSLAASRSTRFTALVRRMEVWEGEASALLLLAAEGDTAADWRTASLALWLGLAVWGAKGVRGGRWGELSLLLGPLWLAS